MRRVTATFERPGSKQGADMILKLSVIALGNNLNNFVKYVELEGFAEPLNKSAHSGCRYVVSGMSGQLLKGLKPLCSADVAF